LSARRLTLDSTGAIAAAICAVHCMATPILLTAVSLRFFEPFAKALASSLTEWAFVLTSAVIGLTSLVPSFTRVHRDVMPYGLFAASFGLLLTSRLMHVAPVAERVVVPVAAILMIAAHMRNRRQCARCHTCVECAPATGI
jgi:formate hydrogenlyase subunit 3/multisubunit Na+/H+ antiporter MnhD subunit